MSDHETDIDIILNRDGTGTISPEAAGVVAWVTEGGGLRQAAKAGEIGDTAKVGVAVVCENEAIIYKQFDVKLQQSQVPFWRPGRDTAQALINRQELDRAFKDTMLPEMQRLCAASKPSEGFKAKTWYFETAERQLMQQPIPENSNIAHLFARNDFIRCSPKGEERPAFVPVYGDTLRYTQFQLDALAAFGNDPRPPLQRVTEMAAQELADMANRVCKRYDSGARVYDGRVNDGEPKKEK